MTERITPDVLLRAYAAGLFPMAQNRDATDLHWIDPRRRGIFPIAGFHTSRRLARRIATCGWRVEVDRDFTAVVHACAAREETWINAEIETLYGALFQLGHAHSIEVRDGSDLIGGVYGVTIGAAFFGESMFSDRIDASKVALAWLMHRLGTGKYMLFDTQFLTPHLASLGAVEVDRAHYHQILHAACQANARFDPPGYMPTVHDIKHRKTQTS